MSPTLAILICHLHARRHQLARLQALLDPQLNDQVQVLIAADDGAMTVGAKRNQLLGRAADLGAAYVAFVDDDDRIAPDYAARILAGLAGQPDALGIEVAFRKGAAPPQRMLLSQAYRLWQTRGAVRVRPINHLNPVRLSLALKAGFADIDSGEDRDYATALRPLLGRTANLPAPPLYFYDYDPGSSATDVFSKQRYSNRVGGDFRLTLAAQGHPGGRLEAQCGPISLAMVLPASSGEVMLWRSGEACGALLCDRDGKAVTKKEGMAPPGLLRVTIQASPELVLKTPPRDFTVSGRILRF